jgi:hypothetical protein
MEQEKNKKIDPRAQLTFIGRTTMEILYDIFQSDLAERIDYSELLHEYGRPEN